MSNYCTKRDANVPARCAALRDALKAMGITYGQLADELDVGRLTIHNMMTGKLSNFSLALLERAEQAAGRLCRHRVLDLGEALGNASTTCSGFRAAYSALSGFYEVEKG